MVASFSTLLSENLLENNIFLQRHIKSVLLPKKKINVYDSKTVFEVGPQPILKTATSNQTGPKKT